MPRLPLGTLALVAALLGTFVIAGPALGATPVGSEFQVNTYTTDYQRSPSVAVDEDGDFVVVWESGSYYYSGSSGSDTSYQSIQAQRYDATGATLGPQFQVNTYTTLRQTNPSVSLDADGDFVVVWLSDGSSGDDTSYSSIQGQRYAATGATLGSEFQVNTYTTAHQYRPSVSLDADGDFVVVWFSFGSAGSDTDSRSVHGQRYDATGATLGSQFQVNTYTTSHQANPSVSLDADGDFVVVWNSYGSVGSDSSGGSIQAQRYDATGATLGSEFQVNSYTTLNQRQPSVSLDADGDFVVVWQSRGDAGSDTSRSVHGQRYDATGATLGSEFQVNTYTTSRQANPSVSLDADGDFVVVWQSRGYAGSDTSGYAVWGQRYDASGNAVGMEFQVNTYTTSWQSSPSVSLDPDGDFVVVWESHGSAGSDTSNYSIQAQRYLPEPSEFLMLSAGIAFLAAVGRRRIKA
jgi:hypothetical protein